MSTFSLFHAAKLTIRVLSEVKDREDAYEFVKMACSGIKGISSVYLVHRERHLLIRGSLTCVQVSNDEQVSSSEPLSDSQTNSRPDIPQDQRIRRTDQLFRAVNVWRGRSDSVKSSASTVVSFGTAPSIFDMHAGQPALDAPVVRVESEPMDAEVFVFKDLVLLASCLSLGENGVDACDLEPLKGFGLSRVVSVLDEIGKCGFLFRTFRRGLVCYNSYSPHLKTKMTQRKWNWIRLSRMHHARSRPAHIPRPRRGLRPIDRTRRHDLAPPPAPRTAHC